MYTPYNKLNPLFTTTHFNYLLAEQPNNRRLTSLYSSKRLYFAHIKDLVVPNCDFRRFRSH